MFFRRRKEIESRLDYLESELGRIVGLVECLIKESAVMQFDADAYIGILEDTEESQAEIDAIRKMDENYKKKLRRFIRQSKIRRCAENQHKDSL